jgi:putative acetyltransferase
MALKIRPIAPADDQAIARIIRTVMPQFGAVGEGFAIMDPEVDHMAEAYALPRSAYFVVEDEAGTVLGGGGVAPLQGGESGVCELRKMYFLEEARGHGAGEAVLRQCLAAARGFGFSLCYLETLERMAAARKLYLKLGFRSLCAPMGKTGHHGCDNFYALDL